MGVPGALLMMRLVAYKVGLGAIWKGVNILLPISALF